MTDFSKRIYVRIPQGIVDRGRFRALYVLKSLASPLTICAGDSVQPSFYNREPVPPARGGTFKHTH